MAEIVDKAKPQIPRQFVGIPSHVLRMMMEVKQKALEACPRALEKIVEAMEGHYMMDRVQFLCIKEILDRGLGRPAQTHEIKQEVTVSSDGSPQNLNHDQLQLLVQNKAVEFVASLHKSGQLQKIIENLEDKSLLS